jgi:excisionase family DNA binding protein
MLLGDREFTSEEVAALCGVTRVTVADWIARGKIGVRWTTGGHRRIPRASLAEFMAGQGYVLPRIVATQRALVVLVDDEVAWRDRLRVDLEASGDFDVAAVEPGIATLLDIAARRPDALLVDLRMPGFYSRQLIEAVRDEPALAATVVVALAVFDEEVSAAKRIGADAALPKSRASELPALLARILTDRQRRVARGESELTIMVRADGDGAGEDTAPSSLIAAALGDEPPS